MFTGFASIFFEGKKEGKLITEKGLFMTELISIIIPVYNVEQYIERCITSILNQTYNNIEVILVNDGSTDRSGDICQKYEEIDSRIKVIHQKNAGPSEARNKALSIAIGKYVSFIDADDYVEKDYIMYLYRLLTKSEGDIACCNTQNFKKGVIVERQKRKEYVCIMNSEEALSQMLYEKKFSNSVWGKLYRREVIDNITFPKGKIFEDMYTTYKFFLNSDKVVYGNLKKYFYMKHENSIMSTTKFHARMPVIEAENELIKCLKNEYPIALEAAYAKLFASSVVCLSNFDLNTKCELYIGDIKVLWKNIEELRIKILFNKEVQFKYKILALLSFLGKRLLCFFYQNFIK